MDEPKIFYVVMKLVETINVDGVETRLPTGQYILPAFNDKELAKEYSCDGKYKIVEMERVKV